MKKLKISSNYGMMKDFRRDPNFDDVVPTIKTLPEWHHKMPLWGGDGKVGTVREEPGTVPTVKFCIPFVDAMTSGYTVLLEEDLEVSSHVDHPDYTVKSGNDLISSHKNTQFPGITVPEEYYPDASKWNNQITFETPKGYSLIFTHPLNRLDLPFFTLTGIIDADKFNGMSVNFPFFMRKDFNGIIPKGTPIAQVIPMKRDKWKLVPGIIGAWKGTKFLAKFNSIELRRYQRLFHVKKSYK